jgi:hypothetical protein
MNQSESALFRGAEKAKSRKRFLNATMVMSTFGKFGPAAEGFLQNLATAACSIGVVD